MRNISLLLIVLFVNCISAQNSLRNFGNLKVFENSDLGFHTNLINDGSFDENRGRVGFYGSQELEISGAFVSQFYDFELFLDNNLLLKTPIRIANNLSFFSGNIKSDKLNSSIYTEFVENSNYNGVTRMTKVDGYAFVRGKKDFEFPIGDENQLKSLRINFQDEIFEAKSAYFKDNPKNQIGSKLDPTLSHISEDEFWRLETTGNVQISISWNQHSELSSSLEALDRIIIAGWNENNQQWENLGNTSFTGDIENGKVTSLFFDAAEYKVFTFASLFEVQEDISKHFLVSANGDGVNDRLVLPELQNSPKNLLIIYNRNGRKVFEKENYSDEFGGFSTSGGLTINRKKGLPDGIYFYVAKMYTLNKEAQGFLYLTR